MSTDFCPACGFEFLSQTSGSSSSASASARAAGRAAPTDGRHSASDAATRQAVPTVRAPTIANPVPVRRGEVSLSALVAGVERLARWRRISGVVIAIDGPYMAKRESGWIGALGKFLLVVFIVGPMLLASTLMSQFLSFLFSGRFSYRRGDRSFISELGRNMASSYLASKVYGAKDEVAVRDVRIRDMQRLEHLIRVRGDLIAGNFNVGDEIEAEGYDRNGTLLFRSGLNKRTRTNILVKMQ